MERSGPGVQQILLGTETSTHFTLCCEAESVSKSCRSSSLVKEVSLTTYYSIIAIFWVSKADPASGSSAVETVGVAAVTYSVFGTLSALTFTSSFSKVLLVIFSLGRPAVIIDEDSFLFFTKEMCTEQIRGGVSF